MSLGNSYFGITVSGFPLELARSGLISIIERRVNTEDKLFFDKFAEASVNAAETFAKVLEIYDASLSVSPAYFVGMTTAGTSDDTGPIDSTASAAGAGLRDVLLFLTGPQASTTDAVKALKTVNDNFDYIAQNMEGETITTGGTRQYDQLETDREASTKQVIKALNLRKGGAGSQSPTRIDVLPYREVMAQAVEKEDNSAEAVNAAGRIIANLLLGSQEPTKISELLAVACNPEYKNGDVFRAIAYSMSDENITKLQGASSTRPDEFAALSAGLDDLAKNVKRVITYTKKSTAPAAPAPSAPATAPAP
jgi:hypothetical protein